MDDILDCIIVGAGFGGVAQGIALRKAGITRFVILEKSGAIGGCWHDNTYPGAACDVPSHLYSYSFEPNPGWSRKFASQTEIEEYIQGCAKKYGVVPHCRFGRTVASAYFDESARCWVVETDQDEHYRARVLVTATGQLSLPAVPELRGQREFRGPQFHSARWPAGFSAQGKRVGVLGSGASAIQMVPELAREAAHLSVFQRSAPYILDKPDGVYSLAARDRFRRIPWLMKLSRAAQYWQHEARFFAFEGNPLLASYFTRRCMEKLRREVGKAELRQKLTPDYPLGCKRILISNSYYPTFNRDNVSLETDRVEAVTESGILMADGREITLDALVYATGFRSTEFLSPMTIVGRNGRRLNDVWANGAEAYLGMCVEGFPNFFMLYGPNTNLGHHSILGMLENQIAFVMRSLRPDVLRGEWTLDVRPEIQARFNHRLQEKLTHTVWSSDCQSWYKTARGKITNNWYGFVTTYRYLTRYAALDCFRERQQ